MTLLAQNPRYGVDNIGFATTIGSDDAGKPAATERYVRFFAKRFESDKLDFAQFKQDFPFYGLGRVCFWFSGSRKSVTPAPLHTCRQISIPHTREGSSRDKIAEGTFSSGPAAWRYDGGYGGTN